MPILGTVKNGKIEFDPTQVLPDGLQVAIKPLAEENAELRALLMNRYSETGNEIRHYSSIRSALTVFLLTVSLTAFSTYFDRPQPHLFLLFAGFLALIAACFACIHFSRRTEKTVIRYARIWDHLTGQRLMSADEIQGSKERRGIAQRMCQDWMNRLLVFATLLIVGVVLAFAIK
jgi:hypothetical protein